MFIAAARGIKSLFFVIAISMMFTWVQTASAQERSMKLFFMATDEFGNSLERAPQIHISECMIHQSGMVKPDTTIPNRYEVELLYDHAITGTRCMVTVSAPGFVSSEKIELGNIQASSDFNIISKPVKLEYTLAVRPYDDEGASLTNADVFFEGTSARVKKGGTYYFAATHSGALEISHPTYVSQSQSTDGLLGLVQISNNATTAVSFKGTGSCMKSGTVLSCGALQASANISVRNNADILISGTTVTLYTDKARTKIAKELGAVERDATQIIGSANVNFAIMSGTYYATIQKQRYNTIHDTIHIEDEGNNEIVYHLDLESPSKISPTRSAATVSRVSAIADLNDTVIVNVVVRSSDSTLLKNHVIEIDTGDDTDVVTFDSGSLTNNQGLVIAYVTASNAGERTLQVKANGLLISNFPKIWFESVEDEDSISPKKSFTEQTPSPIMVGGTEEVTVTVHAKNHKGVYLSGKDVALTSDRASSDVISCDNGKTQQGKVTCIFSSNEAGTSILTATVDDVIIDKIAVSVSPIPS